MRAALWVRLRLLLPLLPIVYADPEPNPDKSLRTRLAQALVHVITSPLIWQAPRSTPLSPLSMPAMHATTQRVICPAHAPQLRTDG